MTESTLLPFRIDRDYDADRASDGVSRYGHYVRAATREDSDNWDLEDAAERRHEVAGLAWRAATPPVMAPGYVRYHHLITGARVYRSAWDGALLAAVTLATLPPTGLAKLWQWRGWPTELQDGHHRPVGPYEEQIGKATPGGYALTTVELQLALPEASVALPALPAGPVTDDLPYTAAQTVGVLVGALNDITGPPVIGAM